MLKLDFPELILSVEFIGKLSFTHPILSLNTVRHGCDNNAFW